MTRVAPRSDNGNRKTSTGRLLALGLGGVLFAVFLYVTNGNEAVAEANETNETLQAKVIVDTDIQLSSVSISTGKVPFYHCRAASSSSSSSGTKPTTTTHLMLLHGARFTKEDWKTSGILEKFCSNPNLAVSAVDLPVAAGHQPLKRLLNTMVEENYISSLPIALVTPSASGLTVVDWIKKGTTSEIPNYIFRWIPVAPPSVNTISKEQVESLRDLENFNIFAIFGDGDTMGKKVTQFLETNAGAKTLELSGGHPVYLDSPDLFVQNVLEDLGLLS
jgi:hypothetical protein